MTEVSIETVVMAHRYLYYVLDEPVLPDAHYDVLERQARSVEPPDSRVHKVGSSLRESYTDAEIAYANSLRFGR
jgi:NAD-dependent DNA ligase